MNTELKTKLNELFKELRKNEYFARQNFWCCQSCACAAIPENKSDKYVFYHRQDTQHAIDSNKLHLAWAGNGKKIVKLARKAGLTVEWNGTEQQRIQVSI